jgi:excisionase family DNA binding protein
LLAVYSQCIIVSIMSNIHVDTAPEKAGLSQVQATLMSSNEAARKLGITPEAASRLVKQGKLPGVKIGRSYVIPRESVDSFSIGYVPARGRPKAKRKYTKRSPKWFQ